MALNLIFGGSGYGKTEELYAVVAGEAIKDLKTNFIMVVPEQDSLRVIRETSERMPGKGILNADVLSFSRFAHRIFDSAGADRSVILDDTGKNLIIRSIVRDLSGDLSVFKDVFLKQGYISEIKSIISEFIQYDISLEDVDRMIGKCASRGYLREKLKDIRLIYEAFGKRMSSRYITREELLDAAIRRSEGAAFLDGSKIFFDGFTGFTPIQYRFIGMLMKRARDIYVTFDYDGQDGELFELPLRSAAHLRKIAEEQGIKVNTIRLYDNEKRRLADNKPLDFLEKRLFRKKTEIYEGEVKGIRIIEADSPVSEVKFVLGQIKGLIARGICGYSQIGVVMSDTACYGRLLKEEATRTDLPVFIDETRGIRLNPFTEYIRSILNIVMSDFSFEGVFHYLKGTLSNISASESDRLENYIRAAGIRGYDRFSKEFKFKGGLSEEELAKINEIRLKLMGELEGVCKALTAGGRNGRLKCGEICNIIQKFLEENDTESKILTRADEFLENGDKARSDEYSQIYDKFISLMDVMRELIFDEEVSLKDYSELVNAGLEEMRVGVVPPGRKCIIAGDLKRSRLNGIKYLFFLGVNEGKVPTEGVSGGILNDMDRQFLSESFTLAPTAYENIGTEKLYFYMAVSKPTDELVLTYSGTAEDGSSCAGSYFLGSIRKLFKDIEIERVSEKDTDRDLNSIYDVKTLAAKTLKEGEGKACDEGIFALKFMKNKGLEAELSAIEGYIFKPSSSDPLSRALTKVLYGNEGRDTALSPSRLEMFVSCAYEHFLRYAINLREREEYGFEKRDLGSLLHEVLSIISGILEDENKSFSTLSDGETERLIEEAARRFLEKNEAAALRGSKRNKYFLNRMKRIMRRTLKTLKLQQRQGSYKTDLFEQPFRIGNIMGRIDRVDVSETAEAVYVSVIDYKSGNKSFDLNRVYYGLDMQLFLYLYGAMGLERERYGDKTIKPGGIFYYHIDDPVVGEEDLGGFDSDEAIENAINSKLKLRGVLNADVDAARLFDESLAPKVNSRVVPVGILSNGDFSKSSSVLTEEELLKFTDHIRKISDESEMRIYGGEIEKNPYIYEGKTPCDYCVYVDMCDEKDRREKSAKRRLRKIY